MIMDEMVEENIELRVQNTKLKRELRRYRKSMRSALNILEPDQRDIIKNDLVDIDNINTEEYAQS
ncbi:MAG: hypothetical protein WCI71_11045 [Bacteroidota bacterium]